jgi:hypothetical protein
MEAKIYLTCREGILVCMTLYVCIIYIQFHVWPLNIDIDTYTHIQLHMYVSMYAGARHGAT